MDFFTYNEPVALSGLDVIGYATVLKKSMLPSVVPPIYYVREQKCLYLPPYHENEGTIYNAKEIPPEIAEIFLKGRDSILSYTKLHAAEITPETAMMLRAYWEITLFDPHFPAKSGHTLWLDRSFSRHYDPSCIAEKYLGSLAEDYIQKAKRALMKGRLKAAELLCSAAISANDRRIEPFVIKGALRRIKKDALGERLMEKMVKGSLGRDEFSALVEYYVSNAKIRD